MILMRKLPINGELDEFVNKIAHRFASFDKTAIVAAKKQINRATLPPEADLIAAFKEFVDSLSFAGFQERSVKSAGVVQQIGVEEIQKNLGYYIGLSGQS